MAFPMNLGFFGKGNASLVVGLIEQIEAGVCGLKLHEDWGTTPAAIDCCLSVADEMDVQVLIHTDSLNEEGLRGEYNRSVQGQDDPHVSHRRSRRRACAGYHQGVRRGKCHPGFDNPTRPYTVNTLDEALDMLMVTHHLDRRIPEDVAFAESRIRKGDHCR